MTVSASLLGFNLELCFLQNAWFRKSRFKGGKGKKLNIGGGGLGYRERPGLGSENSVSSEYNSTMGKGPVLTYAESVYLKASRVPNPVVQGCALMCHESVWCCTSQ